MEVKVYQPIVKETTGTQWISRDILADCRQTSLNIATSKTLVIKESWQTFMMECNKLLGAPGYLQPVTVKQFMQTPVPMTLDDWNGKMMFDQEKIPFVANAHIIVKTLIYALTSFQPAKDKTTSYKMSKRELTQFLNTTTRIGFGQLNFFSKESTGNTGPDKQIGIKFVTENNPYKGKMKFWEALILAELYERVAPFHGGMALLS